MSNQGPKTVQRGLRAGARALVAGAMLAAIVGGVPPALADDDDLDHETAARLLSEGRIRPLAQIIAATKVAVPGEVLGVELELEDGVYVYELKILRPNGRVQEVEVDAANASIRSIEDDD